MSFEHLYDGRMAKEPVMRTYTLKAWLYVEEAIEAEDEHMADELFKEHIWEIQRAYPELKWLPG